MQHVALAVELPVNGEPDLRQSIAGAENLSVTMTAPKQGASGQQALSFDPITGAAVGWFVLQFSGEVLTGLAAHFLSDALHRKLKHETVKVRFPDGVIVDFAPDDPASRAQLESLIETHTRS